LKGDSLDEEEIIRILWGSLRRGRHDPFNDDATWTPNDRRKRLLVSKCDMLVAFTDVPPEMTPAQIARKAVVSCTSDLAAKGVRPASCIVSLGLPKNLARRQFVQSLAKGFRKAEIEYNFSVLGGDTSATGSDLIINACMFGYSDGFPKRKGAQVGDLVAVSGAFGHQAAGLLLLMGKAKCADLIFASRAKKSVLEPVARLSLGIRIASRLSSCTDSSDGLALSLYHLAESSKVDIALDRVPLSPGLREFAEENKLKQEDLALFGGEEFELVCTFDPKYASALVPLGLKIMGKVVGRAGPKRSPKVTLRGSLIPRRGWIHLAV
jgi:thiamine-monophosphate kinase